MGSLIPEANFLYLYNLPILSDLFEKNVQKKEDTWLRSNFGDSLWFSILPNKFFISGFENSGGIFDREGVVVNQEKRSVLADANVLEDQRSNSRSGSRKRSRSRSSSVRRSSDRNRDRSPLRRLNRSKEKVRSQSKDRGNTREWRKRTRSPEKSKRNHSKDREDDYKGRSRSPGRRERVSSPRPSHSNERRSSISRDADYYNNRLDFLFLFNFVEFLVVPFHILRVPKYWSASLKLMDWIFLTPKYYF